MAEEQLAARGIQSPAVLDAMRSVPRHRFVPAAMQSQAYRDSPLAIGLGQTISQPYIVAYMTEMLEPAAGMKVLEIGTGSGYQTAILASLGCEVYSIELLEELAVKAQAILADLRFTAVTIQHGNGFNGWQEEAPFDAIIVTAAPENIPGKLVEQLKEGGRMIVPVGPVHAVQSLKRITRKAAGNIEQDLLSVRFVPMINIG